MGKTFESMVKIRDIYREYVPQFIECQKELETAEKKIHDINNDMGLNSAGREKRLAVQRAIIDQCKEKQNAIASKAKAEATAIRDEVKRRFFAHPDDLNLAAMELLRSGVLSDEEIINIANNSSSTTRRVMGAYLSESPDQNTRMIGITLQSIPGSDDLTLIDGLIQVGNCCLGGSPYTGPAGAENMWARYDSLTADSFNAAKEL